MSMLLSARGYEFFGAPVAYAGTPSFSTDSRPRSFTGSSYKALALPTSHQVFRTNRQRPGVVPILAEKALVKWL